MENELFRKIVASLWKSQLLSIVFFQQSGKHIMVALLLHVSKHRQGRKCSHGRKRAQEEKRVYPVGTPRDFVCCFCPTAGAIPGPALGSHGNELSTCSLHGRAWLLRGPSFADCPVQHWHFFNTHFPLQARAVNPDWISAWLCPFFICFSLGCWISWWPLTCLPQQSCPQSCQVLVCLGGFAHEEQSEVQLLCMFHVHGPVQSSVFHTTAAGRARAAVWGKVMQEWVVWAVGLSELGASRTKGENPALELR